MRPLLAYDADCGPCSAFRRVVGFLDGHRRIDFVSLKSADALGLLDRVAPRSRFSSFHLVGGDGRILSGAAAIPTLARLLPGGRLISWIVESSPWGMKSVVWAYSALSRLHETRTCRSTAPSTVPGRTS